MTTLKCVMTADCAQPVTHIGSKGFLYCAGHAATRKASGYERCRKMTASERALIEQGKPIASYEARPKTLGTLQTDTGETVEVRALPDGTLAI